MAQFQRVVPLLDILVDPQEGWDLARVHMDQVFVGQVLQEYLCPVSAVLCETVEDVEVLGVFFALHSLAGDEGFLHWFA